MPKGDRSKGLGPNNPFTVIVIPGPLPQMDPAGLKKVGAAAGLNPTVQAAAPWAPVPASESDI